MNTEINKQMKGLGIHIGANDKHNKNIKTITVHARLNMTIISKTKKNIEYTYVKVTLRIYT